MLRQSEFVRRLGVVVVVMIFSTASGARALAQSTLLSKGSPARSAFNGGVLPPSEKKAYVAAIKRDRRLRSVLTSGPAYSLKAIAGPVGVAQTFFSDGVQINNAGHITGQTWDSVQGLFGFYYDGTTLRKACGLTNARSIDSQDKIYGFAPYKKKGKTVSELVTCRAGTQTDLNIDGSTLSGLSDTDEAGDIVGGLYVYYNINHAFFRGSGGTIQDLGVLSGAFTTTKSGAAAINEARVVVGGSGTSSGYSHAFRYDAAAGGPLVDLGVPAGWLSSGADGINDIGDIIGWASVSLEMGHAYVWRLGSQPIDLGTPATLPSSQADAINNLGQIVGYASDGKSVVDDGSGTGILYTHGQIYDLNALIPSSSGLHVWKPMDINDNGQIVASAYDASQQWYLVVLSPTQSPAAEAPSSVTPPETTGSAVTTFRIDGTPGSWTSTFPTTYAYQWLRCAPDGANCAAIASATGLSYVPSDLDLGVTLRLRVTATNEYGSSSVQSAPTRVVQRPLDAFAPELRYDSRERFHADSAAEIADNCDSASASENLLVDSFTFAGQYPLYRASSCGPYVSYGGWNVDHLTLDYLGVTYPTPDNESAQAGDYIDEADSYDADYNRMHRLPQYADQIYGRLIRNPDGSAILQYWFFYYYQPNFFPDPTGSPSGGAHEGDWEGILIYVDPNGVPSDATYTQHGDGERCGWNFATHDDLHPVVFPALYSHASYFRPGPHSLPWGGNDIADGLAPPVTPAVTDITNTAPYRWLFWPGRWGGTTAQIPQVDQTSPNGPGVKGAQWDDVLTWISGAKTCSE